MLNLLLITRDPEFAAFAVSQGVQRLFVDLEIHGKLARQGHRDTVISNHSMDDVAAVRAAVPRHELLVRLNPVHAGSEGEIEQVIDIGADIIMLPMFSELAEIRRFTTAIAGRCRFIPLIETPGAVNQIPALVCEPGVDELYIGLNDLHMALGLDFMFQLLADGTVERIAGICREAGMPFGFGGIARMEEGLLPGELVLSEHLRLGSSAVILSRTFYRAANSIDNTRANINFAYEVVRLRESEARLAKRDTSQIIKDHHALLAGVESVRQQICARREK